MYIESRIADNLGMKNSNFIPAKAQFRSTRCHVENDWQTTEEQPLSKHLGGVSAFVLTDL